MIPVRVSFVEIRRRKVGESVARRVRRKSHARWRVGENLEMTSKSYLSLYNAETIIGNCSCVLFLGGKERSTLKEISETLGKETIDLFNTSDTRGSQQSLGINYQKTGKELMSTDELAVMDGGKCILQVQGVRPFFSDKYDITRHPQYKNLSDYDKKNTFDVAKYLSRRLIVKPDDAFETYEYDAPPPATS